MQSGGDDNTPPRATRRRVLGAVAATPLVVAGAANAEPALEFLSIEDATASRVWLGGEYWANRLQDWRLREGWLECLNPGPEDCLRTVALVTRELRREGEEAVFELDVQRLTEAQATGFGGWLIGVGAGQLDWRAACLAQAASGAGGGVLAVMDADGALAFREHVDETAPWAFGLLRTRQIALAAAPFSGRARLRLHLRTEGRRTRMRLSGRDIETGASLGEIEAMAPTRDLCGGLTLVSSPMPHEVGARWGFCRIGVGGDRIVARPDRAFGPIYTALHALNGSVLKLSAHAFPVDRAEFGEVRLIIRPSGGDAAWRQISRAELGEAWVAQFRVDHWQGDMSWDYRLLIGGGDTERVAYEGQIRAEPHGRTLKIGLLNCVMSTARALDGNQPTRQLPQARPLGRYAPENFYFPHQEVVGHVAAHDPDILFFAGDQFYEHNPTRIDREHVILDMLYRWQQWAWAFNPLTRERPAIFLTDDHDVYHGNLWGQGGRDAPLHDQNRGGYVHGADFVRAVEISQKSHNPDADDATPADQDIPVSYGAFQFGGVDFAVLEDRKWKTAPIQGEDLNVHVGEMLGARQEQFLSRWAARPHERPRIVVTQTLWGSLQTSPEGQPLLDFDANSYPPLARARAVELVGGAGALMLSGDQHLASMVQHGVDEFGRGPFQFTAPALATFWQRWFMPARQEEARDFTDGFGAKMRVMAVANPKISFAQYRETITGRYQGIDDRALRSEGYGIVRVDPGARQFVIECWPWNVDPRTRADGQFRGWPIALSFEEVREGRRN